MIKWKSIEKGEKGVRAEKTKYWDKMKQEWQSTQV